MMPVVNFKEAALSVLLFKVVPQVPPIASMYNFVFWKSISSTVGTATELVKAWDAICLPIKLAITNSEIDSLACSRFDLHDSRYNLFSQNGHY